MTNDSNEDAYARRIDRIIGYICGNEVAPQNRDLYTRGDSLITVAILQPTETVFEALR